MHENTTNLEFSGLLFFPQEHKIKLANLKRSSQRDPFKHMLAAI